MKWFRKLTERAGALRECLSEVGLRRIARRVEHGLDRLAERTPLLRDVQPIEERDFIHHGPVNLDTPKMRGKDWVSAIASQCEREAPFKSAPPRRMGH